MIGRSQAGPWWLSAVGERRIKDSYQFPDMQFPSKERISFEKMAEGKDQAGTSKQLFKKITEIICFVHSSDRKELSVLIVCRGRLAFFERNTSILLGKQVGKLTTQGKRGRTMIKRSALLCLHFVGTDHRRCSKSSSKSSSKPSSKPSSRYKLWRLVGWWSSNWGIYSRTEVRTSRLGVVRAQSEQHRELMHADRSWRHCGLQLLHGKHGQAGRGISAWLWTSNGTNSTQSVRNSPNVDGDQFALALLARGQYPLMGDERFTRGRMVPFVMAGPAVVWSNSSFSNFGSKKTSTDVGVVAEVGFEYFFIPKLSIGPSFRYRHVFGPSVSEQGVNLDSNLDQFMVLGRLAYHF